VDIAGIILDGPPFGSSCCGHGFLAPRWQAMSIDPSIEHGAFEPEATAAMAEAFEAACKELHDAGKTELVRKLVAERIIGAACRGELDPVRLRTAALSSILSLPNFGRCIALSES